MVCIRYLDNGAACRADEYFVSKERSNEHTANQEAEDKQHLHRISLPWVGENKHVCIKNAAFSNCSQTQAPLSLQGDDSLIFSVPSEFRASGRVAHIYYLSTLTVLLPSFL